MPKKLLFYDQLENIIKLTSIQLGNIFFFKFFMNETKVAYYEKKKKKLPPNRFRGKFLSSSSTLTPNTFAKNHVQIINNLNNKPLNYHCKFGDDGLRTLEPKGEWEFSFRLHWIALTLFLCYFRYKKFNAVFDVYSAYLEKVCGGINYILLILSKVGSKYKELKMHDL